MINLLPPSLKEEYRYARRNRRMSHWLGAFLLGLVGMAVIGAGGVMYMNNFRDNDNRQIQALNAQLKAENYTAVEKQVTEISSNLNLMVKVLSREVLFSELLTKLGNVIPKNTVLTNLNIQQTTGGIDITAQTADIGTATQLQVNLADPNNQIFAKADIVNVSCSTSSTTDKNYPCTVAIRALFAQNNPFLFINSGVAAKP